MRNTTPVFEGAVRRDFFDPKPVKPTKSPTDWRTVALVSVIVAGVVSTEAIMAFKPAPVIKSDELFQRPGGPVNPRPAPVAPEPVVQPAPEPEVRRASPVEPVVRRGLPVEGQLYVVQMGDRNLLIRFMGSVPNFDALPKHPNLYDYYQVALGGHSWIYMQPSGFSAPCWVDP